MTEIYIAAAVILRGDGAMLLVRKRGTTVFMLPGGKIEQGEMPSAALFRELGEELALDLQPGDASYIGSFEAPAANEAGHVVFADVFRIETDCDITVQAEIDDARWVQREDLDGMAIAPLMHLHILPLVWP